MHFLQMFAEGLCQYVSKWLLEDKYNCPFFDEIPSIDLLQNTAC